MEKISVTKVFKFHSAHDLPEHDGLCQNLHGHTYKLEVTVTGKIQSQQGPNHGMIIDLSDLKDIVNIHLVSVWDHDYLNTYVPVPTVENMVLYARDILKDKFKPPHKLIKIRIWETENSYATWELMYE
uniref:Putative 6-Pyruvoyl tetrahydrobiopterin synthase n=1 Tax=viral metagenome TaxID=1070528 RepID=A0A6M3KJY1_9ZZZZ